MPNSSIQSGNIEVRLARSAGEVDAAQRLRYVVFYEEWGAVADARTLATGRDIDVFDQLMDHLIVIDHARPPGEGQVVGNYRLLRHDRLPPDKNFYSSDEFDLTPLLDSGQRLLELGRSCVLREYRSMPVLQLLWNAIVAYVAEHEISLLFGCASLRGTDPASLKEQLAYLHHFHLAPEELRPRALGANRTELDVLDKSEVDPVRAMAALEPIIKGYLRLGAGIGDGAYIDHHFNAVDVCIVLPTARLTQRYRRHFERSIQRTLPGGLRVEETA